MDWIGLDLIRREDGLIEGRKKGRKEGRKEGRKDGWKDGWKDGRKGYDMVYPQPTIISCES